MCVRGIFTDYYVNLIRATSVRVLERRILEVNGHYHFFVRKRGGGSGIKASKRLHPTNTNRKCNTKTCLIVSNTSLISHGAANVDLVNGFTTPSFIPLTNAFRTVCLPCAGSLNNRFGVTTEKAMFRKNTRVPS